MPFLPLFERTGFDGLFGWARNATFSGHTTVGNRTCMLWVNAQRNSSICTDGDEPVLLQTPSETVFGSGVVQVLFQGPFRRAVDEWKLKVPDSCRAPTPACGPGAVEKMNIYLLHPEGQFDIAGQDVADVKGDAVFICMDGLWQLENYTLASVYELSVLQRFGQYSNCNFYPPVCYGGDTYHVGRQTPLGVGNLGSQCDDEAALRARIGTWYSLPAGGQCKNQDQIIGEDCSWRIEKRIKTIKVSCMTDAQHRLKEACSTSKPPFEDITKMMLDFYASDDPSKGGCPAVVVPEELDRPWLSSGVVVV